MYINEISTNSTIDIEIQTTFCTDRYTVPILNDSFDRYEKHGLTIDLGTEGNQLIIDLLPNLSNDCVITIYKNINNKLHAWQNVKVTIRALNGISYAILHSEEQSYVGNRRQNERYRIECEATIETDTGSYPVTIYDVSETGVAFQMDNWSDYDKILLQSVITIMVDESKLNSILHIGFKKQKRCVLIVRKFTIDEHYIAAGSFI